MFNRWLQFVSLIVLFCFAIEGNASSNYNSLKKVKPYLGTVKTKKKSRNKKSLKKGSTLVEKEPREKNKLIFPTYDNEETGEITEQNEVTELPTKPYTTLIKKSISSGSKKGFDDSKSRNSQNIKELKKVFSTSDFSRIDQREYNSLDQGPREEDFLETSEHVQPELSPSHFIGHRYSTVNLMKEPNQAESSIRYLRSNEEYLKKRNQNKDRRDPIRGTQRIFSQEARASSRKYREVESRAFSQERLSLSSISGYDLHSIENKLERNWDQEDLVQEVSENLPSDELAKSVIPKDKILRSFVGNLVDVWDGNTLDSEFYYRAEDIDNSIMRSLDVQGDSYGKMVDHVNGKVETEGGFIIFKKDGNVYRSKVKQDHCIRSQLPGGENRYLLLPMFDERFIDEGLSVADIGFTEGLIKTIESNKDLEYYHMKVPFFTKHDGKGRWVTIDIKKDGGGIEVVYDDPVKKGSHQVQSLRAGPLKGALEFLSKKYDIEEEDVVVKAPQGIGLPPALSGVVVAEKAHAFSKNEAFDENNVLSRIIGDVTTDNGDGKGVISVLNFTEYSNLGEEAQLAKEIFEYKREIRSIQFALNQGNYENNKGENIYDLNKEGKVRLENRLKALKQHKQFLVNKLTKFFLNMRNGKYKGKISKDDFRDIAGQVVDTEKLDYSDQLRGSYGREAKVILDFLDVKFKDIKDAKRKVSQQPYLLKNDENKSYFFYVTEKFSSKSLKDFLKNNRDINYTLFVRFTSPKHAFPVEIVKNNNNYEVFSFNHSPERGKRELTALENSIRESHDTWSAPDIKINPDYSKNQFDKYSCGNICTGFLKSKFLGKDLETEEFYPNALTYFLKDYKLGNKSFSKFKFLTEDEKIEKILEIEHKDRGEVSKLIMSVKFLNGSDLSSKQKEKLIKYLSENLKLIKNGTGERFSVRKKLIEKFRKDIIKYRETKSLKIAYFVDQRIDKEINDMGDSPLERKKQSLLTRLKGNIKYDVDKIEGLVEYIKGIETLNQYEQVKKHLDDEIDKEERNDIVLQNLSNPSKKANKYDETYEEGKRNSDSEMKVLYSFYRSNDFQFEKEDKKNQKRSIHGSVRGLLLLTDEIEDNSLQI